ncbi:MAG TPA: TonB-dependent receptor, partial [Pyrinomonadaceae bacterium]
MSATVQARQLTSNSFGQAFGGGGRARLLLSCLLLAALSMFAAAPVTFAQGSSGTVRGDVRDPNGAVVPNATVTLVDARGGERKATTTSSGSYAFTSVDPGQYTVRVEGPGFKTSEQQFSLAPNETRGLDVELEVGVASETVTVTDVGSAIKTETGERSDTITASQIENLSIISRSSLELLRVLPGVVAPDPSDPNSGVDRVSFGGGANATANYTVNGIRGVNNNVSIDGSRVIDIGSNNGTIITPNVDMVQEVTVKTSNYAAEYGSGGVQISATTKGGTKDFHGTLYYYFRPEGLQANDRSNSNLGRPRPQTDFKYPGGNLSGPLLLPFTKFNRNRDRLFFFTGFEYQRQRPDRGSRVGTVPTQAERNGDFSNSPSFYSGGLTPAQGGNLCPPDTISWAGCPAPGGAGLDGGARNPVPNGNFAAFRNPLGAALLNLYPLPNFNPAPGTGLANQRRNYVSNVIAPSDRTDLKMRFDYKVSDNTNMYLRLARESESDDSPYGIWWGPSAFELPSHVVGSNLGRSAAVNMTSVINPTMTNEVVLSASKLQLYY